MALLRENRLEGVHPDLRKLVGLTAGLWGEDLMVLEGMRTLARQRQLVDKGSSKTMNSRHLTGHAVDIAPVLDTDGDGTKEISWHWNDYHRLAEVVKQAAEELQISVEWGGDWKSFKDGPHWQLPWKEYPA